MKRAAFVSLFLLLSATAISANESVVATIGQQQITTGDVEAAAGAAFAHLQANYASELKQLQAREARERHQLLERELQRLLDLRALEMEAAARRVDPNALAAGIKFAPVTTAEMQSFYAVNKARIGQPYAEAESQIRDYLSSEHKQSASRSFYDRLRGKYNIQSLLQPHREQVQATGPSIGATNAAVTIIEFADFQCPYCAQSAARLKSLLAKYRDRLNLVFRHLPLADVHPNALTAARAAVCADRQGKFWPMYEALFSNQNALDAPALEQLARRLGLNMPQYAACVTDDSTTRQIDSDINAAFELGISSTPAFLINGRLLLGLAPEADFDVIIQDELRRASSSGRNSESF